MLNKFTKNIKYLTYLKCCDWGVTHEKESTMFDKSLLSLITNPDYTEGQEKFSHLKTANANHAFKDIDYSHINHIAEKSSRTDSIYVCDMQHKSCYKRLEFLEISCSKDRIYITAEVNFRISKWRAHISLLDFTHSLRQIILDQYSIVSNQENLFDEDLFHIKFRILTSKCHELTSIIELFSQNIEKAHQCILSKNSHKQHSLVG